MGLRCAFLGVLLFVLLGVAVFLFVDFGFDAVFINAAMQLLRKEIKFSRELYYKLDKMTRNKRAHYYTHKELEVILEYFGVSQEEFEMLK